MVHKVLQIQQALAAIPQNGLVVKYTTEQSKILKGQKTREYGFGSNETRAVLGAQYDPNNTSNYPYNKNDEWYWLRSPATRSKAYAATVKENGEINYVGQNVNHAYKEGKGINPAFHMDMSKVLFTSAAYFDKEKVDLFGSKESEVQDDFVSENTWKFTVYDKVTIEPTPTVSPVVTSSPEALQ